MIIPTRNHKDAFQRIQQRGVQQACAVVIFVSNECDSLGTLKILTVRLSPRPLSCMIGVACGGCVLTMCSDVIIATHSALVFFVSLPVISAVGLRAEAVAIRESLVQGQARGIVRRPAPRQAVDCAGRGMVNISTAARMRPFCGQKSMPQPFACRSLDCTVHNVSLDAAPICAMSGIRRWVRRFRPSS